MKRFFSILVVFFLAFWGYADYLHWQIGEEAPDFSYAQLRVKDVIGGPIVSTGFLAMNYFFDGSTDGCEYIGEKLFNVAADIGVDYSNGSFVVELCDENEEIIYVSEVFDFTDVWWYIITDDEFSPSWTYTPVLVITEFVPYDEEIIEPVPEPTTLALLALGVTAIAFRRKVS